MSGTSSVINGKKGGRPNSNMNAKISIPNINLVILTESQYETLLEKYGYGLLINAIYIFESWLENSPKGLSYRGKNNYAHFREDGWVINSAKKEIKRLYKRIK